MKANHNNLDLVKGRIEVLLAEAKQKNESKSQPIAALTAGTAGVASRS